MDIKLALALQKLASGPTVRRVRDSAEATHGEDAETGKGCDRVPSLLLATVAIQRHHERKRSFWQFFLPSESEVHG
eukprot:1228229-Amphidinium_carterae.4